jgi:hypothetical protein
MPGLRTAETGEGLRLADEFFAEVSPSHLMVLDSSGRIVFANAKMREFLGRAAGAGIAGLRFDEAMAGIAGDGASPEPCDNAEFASAVGSTRCGELREGEFTLRCGQGASTVYLCHIRSMETREGIFTAVSMDDLSPAKRCDTFEKVVHNDLLNATSGLMGLLDVIRDADSECTESGRLIRTARLFTEFLFDEILFSRALAFAEAGMLEPLLEPVPVNWVLDHTAERYASQVHAGLVRLEVLRTPDDPAIMADRRLVVRVLLNLLRNAVEASPKEVPVRLSSRVHEGAALFCVHNSGAIPAHVRGNIFRRSFSTKGRGRGLGTYSARLFTEKYLGGRVWFTSSEADGTNFYVEIPLEKA